jgi:glycosyltransferase involved in cell wall biosynthesis
VQPGDVVVAMTDPPLASVPVGRVVRSRRAVLVNWLQDVFPEVAEALGVRIVQMVGRPLRAMRDRSLRVALANVVLGERMREVLLDRGLPAEQVHVIPNWADGTRVYPVAPGENPLRSEWALEGRFVVGYSGNLGRVHEFETIVGAAERLRDDPRVVFLFIGGGAQRGWLEREVSARGLRNVHFRPYQPADRLALSLSLPDVHLITLRPALEGLVVPSKYYGVAAAGRPVIYVGDPAGEVPRVLNDTDSGFVVPPGESQNLAALVKALEGDADRVRVVGARARAVFDARFDRSLALSAWLALLRHALGEVDT